jgi:hypothetical protein
VFVCVCRSEPTIDVVHAHTHTLKGTENHTHLDVAGDGEQRLAQARAFGARLLLLRLLWLLLPRLLLWRERRRR